LFNTAPQLKMRWEKRNICCCCPWCSYRIMVLFCSARLFICGKKYAKILAVVDGLARVLPS